METLSIITHNPYRVLGVFSNSPKKDIVANKGKLSAFLKVGKTLEFPLDLKTILPPIQRSVDLLSQAESALSLAKDQLRYVLFWFVKQTPIDDIAFNHLKAGDVDTAISIWEKKTSFSSLQNIMVCALIKGDYRRVFSNANILFEEYLQNYIDLLSNQITIATTDLIHLFLDCLFEEKGINHSVFLNLVDNSVWNDYIKTKQVQPLIDSISKEIEKAASVNRKDYKARYLAGCVLKKNTTNLIKQLKQLLPTTDMQYQILIDKLGLEILQCGIDYFNASEEPDAAIKAMELQKYALSIVVGKAAKDRCKKNVDILQKVIEELPPIEVFEEDKAIRKKLSQYFSLTIEAKYAKDLILYCEPYLFSIKKKAEENYKLKSYYTNISTIIGEAALYNVFQEVNDKGKSFELYLNQYDALYLLIVILRNAWNVCANIDKMDVPIKLKNDNRNCWNSLYSIVEKMGGFDTKVGELAARYLNSIQREWYTMERPELIEAWDNGTFDEMKYKITSSNPTSGFMKGLHYERIIDLRTERDYYIRCSSDNVRDCEVYLQKYPKGKYRHEVQGFLEKNALDKCDTLKAYREFVLKFPSSRYAVKANKEIEKMYILRVVRVFLYATLILIIVVSIMSVVVNF